MRLCLQVAAWALLLGLVNQGTLSAGLFKMDFGSIENDNLGEELPDWDVFPTFDITEFDNDLPTWNLSDFSTDGDNDVVLTILDN